jgi:hypothetical protein
MAILDLLKGLAGRYRNNAKQMSAKDVSSQLPVRTEPAPDRVSSFFFPVFWGSSDPKQVTEKMQSTADLVSPACHFADNLLTWGRNLSMFDDAAFVRAWRDNAESDADHAIVWRRYVLACAAYHCVQLDGDFVECGAYTGVGIKTVVDYLGGTAFPKTFWGYDVFEHEPSMLNHPMPEHGTALYERVCRKFQSYPQVRLLKGLIPEVFAFGCPERISYLHIDLNQAPAEVASLDHLFDKMVPGGILILDDYEWAGVYRAQKLAEDDWFEKRRYRVIPLPTGQGILCKR